MLAFAVPAAAGTTAYGKDVVDAFLDELVLEESPSVRGVVFDVGANDGEWTRWLLRRAARRGVLLRRLQVHAFEPQPGYAASLRALVRASDGAVRFHPAAAARESSLNATFYPSANPQAASLVGAIARAYTGGGEGEPREPLRVRTVNLAAVMHAVLRERPPALFKCDVEGAEYALLARLLLTGALCRVRHLLIEWHLNALPPSERLAGLGLRTAFDALLRDGCIKGDAWQIEHDEYPDNNRGEPVDGLADLCARKNATKRTRWRAVHGAS